ncbi:hypothetical protein Q3G72_028393 [Acer saccharum]|nr:hypothetical protein Q3G72_028393 [Acer saccharum]
MALLSAASVSMVLVMMGAYGMAIVNLERLTLVWGRAANLSCVLDAALPAARWPAVAEAIAQFEGVDKVVLVTPEQALARFAARSAEAQALVDGVDPNILPATLELSLAGGHVEIERLQALASRIGAVAGVASVEFGAELVERLRRLIGLLRWGGLGIGVLLGGATVFLLSNTIRLTVYARREEILILRLVGATPFFVRMPFLLEGALWGLGGGVLGIMGLYGVHTLLAQRLSAALSVLTGGVELALFRGSMALSMLAAGVALGVLGSALALRRFLDSEPA